MPEWDRTRITPEFLFEFFGSRPERLTSPRFAELPKPETPPIIPRGHGDGPWDIERWIRRSPLEILAESSWNGTGRKWLLAVCPFNPEHTDRSATIRLHPSGAVSAGCSHNSCTWDWATLRERIDGPRRESNHARTLNTGVPSCLADMLTNYVVLSGADGIWDIQRRRIVTQAAVKLAHPTEFSQWMKDPARRMVDKDDLVFAPQGCREGQLNVFQGLGRVPEPGNCDLMLKHLRFMCGGNPDLTWWVTRWLALPLQQLGTKMRTSLVIRGIQGSGKNLLAETIMAMYGKHGTIIDQTALESPYTGWASGMLFVVADEVISKAEAKNVKNRVKGLITGEHISIEEKFQPRRLEANHMNILFLSNELMPVIVEESDRRFAILSVEEKMDQAYYRELAEERDNGGIEAFMHFLMNVPMDGFNANTPPPDSHAKRELMELCLPTPDLFMQEWLRGESELPVGACQVNDLFEAYRIWAKRSGETYGVGNKVTFGRIASKYGASGPRKVDGTTLRCYVPEGQPFAAENVKGFRAAVDEMLKEYQARKL